MLFNIVILEGGIALIGLAILMYLHRRYIDWIGHDIIIMVGIAILLNAMIFTFCVISYSHISISEGPPGPEGVRGGKGMIGKDGKLNTCAGSDISMSSGELKSKNKRTILTAGHKPYIIDDGNLAD